MESTSTYHLPVQRFFTKNNYNVQVINPILGKNNTKTMNDIYSSMIELSRQEKHLTESLVRSKNRFKQINYYIFIFTF